MSDPSLPVASPPTDPNPVESDIWGVLLAAGTSARYGDRNKLLRNVDGDPMVRRALESLLNADLAGIVAVVGYEAVRVEEAIRETSAEVCRNDSYDEGQSTSVRAGVGYADQRGADAVLIALGDMPYVSSETVDALLAAYDSTTRSALAAAYDGRRGNPVVFGSEHFDALTDIDGDVGGREILLRADDAALIETDDPGVLRDIDTPDDWQGPDAA